ncbi:54S ribosomal protein L25, mitochondrial [Rhizoctonia solani]
MPAKVRTANTLVARFLERAAAQSPNPGALVPNPFLPQKNSQTGRWHGPQYSLRRQKELVKQARADGVIGLLPPGVKARREDGAGERSDVASASSGLPALNWEGEPAPKSTVGIRSTQRRFKGHKWEREAKERAEFVAKRMETMAKRIAEAKAAKIQERTKARPSLPF